MGKEGSGSAARGQDCGTVLGRPQEDVLALRSLNCGRFTLELSVHLNGKEKRVGARGRPGGWRQPRHLSTPLPISPQVCPAYSRNQAWV